jgi:hypothetical protein
MVEKPCSLQCGQSKVGAFQQIGVELVTIVVTSLNCFRKRDQNRIPKKVKSFKNKAANEKVTF